MIQSFDLDFCFCMITKLASLLLLLLGTRFSGTDFGEGAAQFNVRRCGELPLLAHGERSGLQTVQVGHHQQQVRRRLHGQEAAARDVYAHGVLKALDGSADGRLQLDDVQTTVQRLQRVRSSLKSRKLQDWVFS